MEDFFDSILIREAHIDDADAIYSLMNTVQSELPDKSMYIISDAERIVHKLSTDCFGYVAFHNDEMIAFYLFQYPSADDIADNLGYRIGLSYEERSKVLILDSVAVSKGYRRIGLSTFLLKLGIRKSNWKEFEWILTTVDPRNSANLRLLNGLGFNIVKSITSYCNSDTDFVLHQRKIENYSKEDKCNGVERYILAKKK